MHVHVHAIVVTGNGSLDTSYKSPTQLHTTGGRLLLSIFVIGVQYFADCTAMAYRGLLIAAVLRGLHGRPCLTHNVAQVRPV